MVPEIFKELPASNILYSVYKSPSLNLKRLGRDADPSLPPSAVVKKE